MSESSQPPKQQDEDNRKKHLQEMEPIFKSADEYTPGSVPRQTQTSIGFYLVPDDKTELPKFQTHVSGSILDRWCRQEKAHWVPNSNRDAYGIFDSFRKHNVQFKPYTGRTKFMLFPRSPKYEIEYLKEQRQKYGYEMLKDKRNICPKAIMPVLKTDPPRKTWTDSIDQWPVNFSDDERRRRLSKVGQPFESEALSFYYNNYPPPTTKLNIKF